MGRCPADDANVGRVTPAGCLLCGCGVEDTPRRVSDKTLGGLELVCNDNEAVLSRRRPWATLNLCDDNEAVLSRGRGPTVASTYTFFLF